MGTEVLNGLSFSKNGFVSTTYADDAIVGGYGHAVAKSMTLVGEATINFLIDMSSVDIDKTIFILPCILSSSDQQVEFRLYEDTDYSDGTLVETFNPNRNFSDEKQTVLKTGATGIDKGNILVTRNAFANHKDSEKSSSYSFLILNKSKKYLAEFENLSASNTIIDYSTMLFEV